MPAPVRILLLEDEADMRNLVRLALTRGTSSRWQVDTLAGDPGPDFPWQDYDLILSDWMLGRDDPLEFLRRSVLPLPPESRPRCAIFSVVPEMGLRVPLAQLAAEGLAVAYVEKIMPVTAYTPTIAGLLADKP